MHRPSWFSVLLGMATIGSGSLARAQFDTPPPPADAGAQPDRDPLASKQQIARDRMLQLEDRMYRLIEKLAAGEPEQAQRLEEALRRSKELLIRRHMDEIIDLLDKGDLAAASETGPAVTKGVEQLLAILLAEPDHRKELQQEAERLRAFERRIQELIEQQQRLKNQIDPASAPADAKDAASQQHKLEQRTDRLARDMQGGKNSSDSSSQPAGDTASRPSDDSETQPADKKSEDSQPEGAERNDENTPSDQPAPGTENVQQAQQHMQQAEGQLKNSQNQQARQSQQEAVDQLEEARRQLQETIDQLRREQREEILRNLESRFSAMLAKQEVVNRRTAELDAKGPAAWTHADELAIGGLARDEDKLAGEADEALHVLEEEGTTIVFPQVVEELRDDLKDVAARLNNRQTGGQTSLLQASIIDLLKELLGAVQQLREQMETAQSAPDMSPSDTPPPLLPGSAELKLLRSCQARVNRMTERLADSSAENRDTSADRDEQVRKTTERQKQIAEMARKMNERITGQ